MNIKEIILRIFSFSNRDSTVQSQSSKYLSSQKSERRIAAHFNTQLGKYIYWKENNKKKKNKIHVKYIIAVSCNI